MDNHATTRTDPRVVAAMTPFFDSIYGNPGSVGHDFGREAREAVESARASIAASLHASPREVVFTSGATESNNLALRGVCRSARRRGDHVITVATEHKAVLDPLARLQREGFRTTLLAPRAHGDPRAGWLDPQHVVEAIQEDTALVSVMLASNEIGVLQPIADIGAACRDRGVLFHCDATQAVGRMPVDVSALNVDLLSFSGHKMYGPKGVGGLIVRRRPGALRLQPQQDGGGQEHGLRSGTLNTPGIVGMAKALELCDGEMTTEPGRLASLRDRLYSQLVEQIDGVVLNGPDLGIPDLRLPGNLNCSFEGVDGEALMMNIGELAVSSGSACTSANPEPSHVLRAIGVSEEHTRASLRFGLGRFNTEEEVYRAAARVAEAVKRLRALLR